MKSITQLPAWRTLLAHKQTMQTLTIRDLFSRDTTRASTFTHTLDGLTLDFSRHRLNTDTINLLMRLADECHLSDKIKAFFNGSNVNATESRPALHTALRNSASTPFLINGQNITADIATVLAKMQAFTDAIHNGTWRGVTQKKIRHIVNIGIGGSFTGPKLVTDALQHFAQTKLQLHFISSVDSTHVQDVLACIDPETTLVIVSSKSFTTLETLTNLQSVREWMQQKLGTDDLTQHLVAITAATDKAIAAGIPEQHIFPIWDWVGGRYSVWSAIGLPIMLLIGSTHFAAFLAGAKQMDEHFCTTPFAENLPVLLGMIGIWYTNFYGASAHAIIPYAHRLRYLIPYLQQAEMESNGKTVDLNHQPLSYATCPILFGEEGVIGQHTYHQLLHQGQHLIPVDFILVKKITNDNLAKRHQPIILASALSQAAALMRGKTAAEAEAELLEKNVPPAMAAELAQHQLIPGNKPSNLIFLDEITPYNLGMLLALYEHKIFVQGCVWNINSFDQWGVELGKQLLPAILANIKEVC